MKSKLLSLILLVSLTGCSPEFWAAIDSTYPAPVQCSYYDPVYNVIRYYSCSSSYAYGYYYTYPPTYLVPYGYRSVPPVVIVNNKKDYGDYNKKKNVNTKYDSRRSTGVNRQTSSKTSERKSYEQNSPARKSSRSDLRSNQD